MRKLFLVIFLIFSTGGIIIEFSNKFETLKDFYTLVNNPATIIEKDTLSNVKYVSFGGSRGVNIVYQGFLLKHKIKCLLTVNPDLGSVNQIPIWYFKL